MTLPTDLTLSADDLRYLRCVQLSLLTGIDASNFSDWNQGRRMSEHTLERLATRLHLSKPEILQGFELRRQDAATARSAQAKANQLITFLGLDKETA